MLGAIAAISATGVILVALAGDGGNGTGPSAVGRVEVSGPPRSSLLPISAQAPSFSAPILDGGRMEWTPGAPTVIAIWAPWCPHCQVELPVLAKVSEGYPSVELVTIATAIGESPGPSVDGYMEDNGLTFPVAIDDSRGTLSAAFGIQGFPTIYFVNSDGTVAAAMDGEVPEPALNELFGSLT